MSRLLLLFVCLIWMTGVAEPAGPTALRTPTAIPLFLCTPIVLILAVGGWSRWLARRVSARSFSRDVQRLNWIMLMSRLFVVAWFGAGVFAFGWPAFVLDVFHVRWFDTARLPGLIVGTAPAMLTWIGLWWAQFPIDRALRQQGLTENLLDGLPIHSPPGLTAYLGSNIRLQLLFTVLPVMMISAVHDVVAVAVLPRLDSPSQTSSIKPPNGTAATTPVSRGAYAASRKADAVRDQVEGIIWFLSAGFVFVMAPEFLRRILQTSSLRDGPLRQRLESLCKRSGMRYRDILVWHTHFNVGNAAVMGLLPRFRYILLSDLLLERMEDEQIEAVFAHEVGHVVHRHMVWYVIFFLILVLMSVGPGTVASDWIERTGIPQEAIAILGLVSSAGAFWLIFGYLSRRFERQADVYAARMMEVTRMMEAVRPTSLMTVPIGPGIRENPAPALDTKSAPMASHVGKYGANLFASALHRVATINNIPVTPRPRQGSSLFHQVNHVFGSLTDLAHDWLHGSIPSRMDYLRSLSTDPALTNRFDRVMTRLYSVLLFILVASAAYVIPMMLRG